MPVVLNEVKQAEHIIEKGEVGNKPTSTLFLLGKYYRVKENLGKEQTFNKLNEFMKSNYKNYNSALWEDLIEDISKKSNKYSLREINSIGITQQEFDKISKIENLKYRKLLFTMLCYAKLYDRISENNNGWINTDIKEIFKTARVSVKYRNDKFLYLNDLERTELISFSNKNDNLNIRVNFVDMNGESVLDVDDFRELGYEYLNYIKKGRFIKCTECNRTIKKNQKTGRPIQYCKSCAIIIQSRQNKEWQKKYR
jgi:hypothetical protein